MAGSIGNEDLLTRKPVAPLGLIPLKSIESIGSKVDKFLLEWRAERPIDHLDSVEQQDYAKDTFIINTKCPRFGSGEAKATISDSIRGLDIYILVDVMNYSLTYSMCGQTNHMSPDDHYADLKRTIAAIGGKAHRVNCIIPFLYESRQHKRASRESLDCAVALQELVNMGVDNIITFDAHDPRVMNSIPLHGFESIRPAYQFIKNICKKVKDLQIDNDHLMIISPDEGAMDRAVYMANVLGVDVGMFYKRRDYSRVVDGRNPIVAHEFLGDSVEGKDVIIIDDMISSGESMIDVARQLKKRKANRIFAVSTFGLFTNGLEAFDQAVEDGVIYKVVTTPAICRNTSLISSIP